MSPVPRSHMLQVMLLSLPFVRTIPAHGSLPHVSAAAHDHIHSFHRFRVRACSYFKNSKRFIRKRILCIPFLKGTTPSAKLSCRCSPPSPIGGAAPCRIPHGGLVNFIQNTFFPPILEDTSLNFLEGLRKRERKTGKEKKEREREEGRRKGGKEAKHCSSTGLSITLNIAPRKQGAAPWELWELEGAGLHQKVRREVR